MCLDAVRRQQEYKVTPDPKRLNCTKRLAILKMMYSVPYTVYCTPRSVSYHIQYDSTLLSVCTEERVLLLMLCRYRWVSRTSTHFQIKSYRDEKS